MYHVWNVCVCSREMRALLQTLDVLNTPKNPYLNQAAPKNTCQIFRPKKIPELKISNPKISPLPPRLPLLWGVDLVDIYLLPKMKLFAALLSGDT